MLQAGKSGLSLLLLQGLAIKTGVEASTVKPQEDDLSLRCLSCVGSALATSGLLVEDALARHSLLAFEGSLFVKKALSGTSSLLAGGHLAFVGSRLVKKALVGCHLEAVVLVLPQFVDCPLLILVGAFRAGVSPKKNGPPGDCGGRRPAVCRSSQSACWSHSLLRRGQPTSSGGLNFR
jgi:hypothetical protein